jgi:hypothetical protein
MTNGADEKDVIMGIIDDGIAFGHQRFRKIVGGNMESRVEFWWLQDGVFSAPVPFPPPPLPPIPFGTQLSKPEIDYYLAQCLTTPGMVDEEEFYRRVGLTDYRRAGHKSAAWRLAHGTHVMDLACGYDQDLAPDNRPIVCVQLPVSTTADTSGGSLFPFVHQAIYYILNCADRIAADRGVDHLPVVINLSYGYFAGPHDGTSRIEDMIDRIVALSQRRGINLRFVLPVGNSFLLRTHAQVSFGLDDEKEDDVVSLNWRVLPDGKTPSYLEIWLPYTPPPIAASRLKVTVTSPTGASWSVDELGPPQQFGPGPFYGELRYAFWGGPTQRGMFRATVNATKKVVDQDPALPLPALAPAGVWTVQLENQNLAEGEIVHLWVQRDDSLYGFPLSGRQSYLDNECYIRFDNEGRDNEADDLTCPVQRASTINAIATGQHPVVLGGFLRKEMKMAKYSSAGPITPVQANAAPDPYRPDAAVPTDDSLVHYGLLAAGSRSGSVVAMNGTSVAAPQIARAIADDLAAGGAGDRATVRGWAAVYPTSPTPPSMADRSGAGGVDLPPLINLQRFWT